MNRSRKTVVAAVVAAIVAIAITTTIVVVGLTPIPEFPSVAEQPTPALTGTIAYSSFDSEDTFRTCVHVVAASTGVDRQLRCSDDYSAEMAWLEDGRLAIAERSDVERSDVPQWDVRLFDVATGAESENFQVGEGDPAFSTTLFSSEPHFGVFQSGAEEQSIQWQGRAVLEVDGPRDYFFETPQESPDKQWLLVSDSESRLIVVAANATGNADARLLVQMRRPKADTGGFFGGSSNYPGSTSPALWFQDGSTKNTVDLAALRARAALTSTTSATGPVRLR